MDILMNYTGILMHMFIDVWVRIGQRFGNEEEGEVPDLK